MNERERIFKQLQKIGESIVAMFGKNCETCIHDLTDLHHSLIHINGAVTGREIGAPATDLLVKLLGSANDRPEDLHNYRTVSGDGRTLKSSTIFISDSSAKPLFAFCINFDTTEYFNASQALQHFLIAEQQENPADSSETFAQSPSETIEALFQQAVLEIGKQPATMSTEEKTDLVEILERNGALQFKGAVEQIALLAGVSKYTIYNYLKKIHARQAINHL
ncbi:MAG: transcriptional regulator [Desulfobulbaceae bacterium]|nr:MAG: transcriptional regulator [Desulfobulbaceae bacterium]